MTDLKIENSGALPVTSPVNFDQALQEVIPKEPNPKKGKKGLAPYRTFQTYFMPRAVARFYLQEWLNRRAEDSRLEPLTEEQISAQLELLVKHFVEGKRPIYKEDLETAKGEPGPLALDLYQAYEDYRNYVAENCYLYDRCDVDYMPPSKFAINKHEWSRVGTPDEGTGREVISLSFLHTNLRLPLPPYSALKKDNRYEN